MLDALGRGFACKPLMLLDQQAQVLHAARAWERGQRGLGLTQTAFDLGLDQRLQIVHLSPLYGTSGLPR